MGSIKKESFLIDGMSCKTCETKLEESIMKLSGVISAHSNYKKGVLIVEYDTEITNEEAVKLQIEAVGFEIKNILNTKKNTIFEFIIPLLVIVVLFILSQKFGNMFNTEIKGNTSFAVLFAIGIITSFHCIGMCGGINIYASSSKTENSFIPAMQYNFGRVVSYSILGGIIGQVGSVLNFSNNLKAVLIASAGIVMVLMGINMAKKINIPFLNNINFFKPIIKKLFSGKHSYSPFVIGLLNGLMPCGPMQAMQIYALGTGSFINGFLSMMFFSLGTYPLMFGLGAASGFIQKKFGKTIFKISALLIIFLGFVMISRGLAFSGGLFHSNKVSGTQVTTDSKIEPQIIKSEVTYDGYPNIKVKQGIPVKWYITANAEVLNGCNEKLIIPEYNIEKQLKAGENLIEFTPTKSGTIGYSCWMGMIRAKIEVE